MSLAQIKEAAEKGKALTVQIAKCVFSFLKQKCRCLIALPQTHDLCYRWLTLIAILVTFLGLLYVILELGLDREPETWEIREGKPDTLLVFNASSRVVYPAKVDGCFSDAHPLISGELKKLIASVDFTKKGNGEDAGKLFVYSEGRFCGGLASWTKWREFYGPVTYDGQQRLGIPDFAVADLNEDGMSEIVLVANAQYGTYLPSLLAVVDETGSELVLIQEPVKRLETVDILKLEVAGSEHVLIVTTGWQLVHTFEQTSEQISPHVVQCNPHGAEVGPMDSEVSGVLSLFQVGERNGKLQVEKLLSMRLEWPGYGIFEIEADDRDRDYKDESITFWLQGWLKYGVSFVYGLDLPAIEFIEEHALKPFWLSRDQICFELFETDIEFYLTRGSRWCDKSPTK